MSVDATEMRLTGLRERVALVTGAARGIGLRIVETLAALGARAVAGDLSTPRIPGVLGVELDVTSERSVDTAFSIVEEKLGAPDIVVLNAGVFGLEPTEETSLRSWRNTMSVNLDGAFLCARRALPAMRARGFGRLVAIGSATGINGDPEQSAAYAASKAGVMALMKSIAREYGRHGITANALAPTIIRTPMLDPGNVPGLVDRIPVGRVGETDDVAACVAFLCSDHASYITGEVLDVTGGYLID
jgi:NAD(P)-dependent dehydrogenase (short-subunit alcohol dehydrogenase family)